MSASKFYYHGFFLGGRFTSFLPFVNSRLRVYRRRRPASFTNRFFRVLKTKKLFKRGLNRHKTIRVSLTRSPAARGPFRPGLPPMATRKPSRAGFRRTLAPVRSSHVARVPSRIRSRYPRESLDEYDRYVTTSVAKILEWKFQKKLLKRFRRVTSRRILRGGFRRYLKPFFRGFLPKFFPRKRRAPQRRLRVVGRRTPYLWKILLLWSLYFSGQFTTVFAMHHSIMWLEHARYCLSSPMFGSVLQPVSTFMFL